MKKTLTIDKPISNLYSFLLNTDADEVVVRTTKVHGGWHDVEFDASKAGFNTMRFTNKEYEARHEFSECYKFWRK